MTTWIIQRRRCDDENDPQPWSDVGSGTTLQEAAWYYNRKAMYIRCHEQRLLDPDGKVVLHHQDVPTVGPRNLSPPPWREKWRELLVPG